MLGMFKSSSYEKGLLDGKKAIIESQKRVLEQGIRGLIGMPVICTTEGRVNLIVGMMIGVTELNPGVVVPLVSDYVDFSTVVLFGKIFVYSEERLKALSLLSGQQRDMLFAHEFEIVKNSIQTQPDVDTSKHLNFEDYVETLKANGFYTLEKVRAVTRVTEE